MLVERIIEWGFVYLWHSGNSSTTTSENSVELAVIEKADLENHNKEGGLWVIIHGKVYDLQEFKDQVILNYWYSDHPHKHNYPPPPQH